MTNNEEGVYLCDRQEGKIMQLISRLVITFFTLLRHRCTESLRAYGAVNEFKNIFITH